MPMLMVQTNVEVAAERRGELLSRLSAGVAAALGKPERYVMVALEDDTPMLFAGSPAPAAYLELKSIGLPGDATSALSAVLCELMERELGVEKERVYIEFADAARQMWGWNGGTF